MTDEEVWLAAYAKDDNHIWATGSGEHQNVIDYLLAEIESHRHRPCHGHDNTCPCPDGLQCHYSGSDAWPLPCEVKIEQLQIAGREKQRVIEDLRQQIELGARP